MQLRQLQETCKTIQIQTRQVLHEQGSQNNLLSLTNLNFPSFNIMPEKELIRGQRQQIYFLPFPI